MATVVQSFLARGADFTPLPFLGNPHVQTVLALFLTGPVRDEPTRERRVLLPDGDRLLLYDSVPSGWEPGDRIAIIVHGLGGSHRSVHVTRQAAVLLRAGVRAVRMELRAAGKGIAFARKTYNAGSSDDLRAALAEVRRWSPTSPTFVIGQSLGGNVALKLAGEAADDPVPGLAGVVAIGPPIDVARCAALLAEPRNRVYEQFFLRALMAHLSRHRRIFPELAMPRFPRRMTLRLFDELYTAPFGGFNDADELYRRTSSLPLIPRIAVPTLVLTARDDPFIAVEPFESLRAPANVEVRVVGRGGHLGFVGRDGAGGLRWTERTAAAWILRAA
ncbi:MAG TPA: alpha/beta fold hydrolase [Gemmataceae bacterium]|nr:alpha/beta fold hydrolase [Gemmataceae bacterium]